MLTVIGIDNRDDVRLIKKYAYWCLSRFVKNSIIRKTQITIKFISPADLSSKIEQKELKQHSAWMNYDSVNADHKKFTITLDKSIIKNNAKKQLTRYKDSLKNLGHEIVHVKQYLNNEIFDYSDGITSRYMGGRYTYTGKTDETYWESPWEIEAYGRMEGLYQMFLEVWKDKKG